MSCDRRRSNGYRAKLEAAIEQSLSNGYRAKLEQKWLHHCEAKKTRIISIDGGGTTDIVAEAALIHLEDQIRAKTGDSHSRIADFFDIIAGTGIGALFAAMLTADDGDGRSLFTAREIVKFVTEKQSKPFNICWIIAP
uniref:Putative inactive patatin-like protein 9 n=1 Tax=Davidia involucrata TaxID=16924 RepID=A0A5B7AN90_DAVIN